MENRTMSEAIELRFQTNSLEVDVDGALLVKGYVNKTGQRSEVLNEKGSRRFVEKIMPGVFKEALENRDKDIDFLAEHDSKRILSSTRNNSLFLEEDKDGLYMEAVIAPTSWGKDAHTLIKSGILRNMSFGFKVLKDSWNRIDGGLMERTIKQIRLFEVSVVKDPAYSQSTIEARGIEVLGEVEIPIETEEKNMDKVIELIEALGAKVDSVISNVAEVRSAQEKLELRSKEKSDLVGELVQPIKEALLEAIKEERSQKSEIVEPEVIVLDEPPKEDELKEPSKEISEDEKIEDKGEPEKVDEEEVKEDEESSEDRSLDSNFDSILSKLNQLKQGEN